MRPPPPPTSPGTSSSAAPPTAGTDSRNENAAASRTPIPRHSAATTVAPEREIPGTIATAWARPTTTALPGPGRPAGPRASAARAVHTTQPVTSSATPVTAGLSKSDARKSPNPAPATAAGTDANISSPPYRSCAASPRTAPASRAPIRAR